MAAKTRLRRGVVVVGAVGALAGLGYLGADGSLAGRAVGGDSAGGCGGVAPGADEQQVEQAVGAAGGAGAPANLPPFDCANLDDTADEVTFAAIAAAIAALGQPPEYPFDDDCDALEHERQRQRLVAQIQAIVAGREQALSGCLGLLATEYCEAADELASAPVVRNTLMPEVVFDPVPPMPPLWALQDGAERLPGRCDGPPDLCRSAHRVVLAALTIIEQLDGLCRIQIQQVKQVATEARANQRKPDRRYNTPWAEARMEAALSVYRSIESLGEQIAEIITRRLEDCDRDSLEDVCGQFESCGWYDPDRPDAGPPPRRRPRSSPPPTGRPRDPLGP